jgi:hypothetical protein
MEAAVNDQQVQAAPRLTPMQKLVAAHKRKKALENELKEVGSEIEVLSEECREKFIQEGIQSMRVDGRTVYIYRQIFSGIAEGYGKPDVKGALEELGLDDLIGYNSQSLNAYVRELINAFPEFFNAEGSLVATEEQILEALPDPLKKTLRVSEKIDIRVKK